MPHSPSSLAVLPTMSVYCGSEAVATYTSVQQEYSALTTGCGVTDANWRTGYFVSGEDRTRWLNGMLTNNVRDLAEGRGTYGFFLNPQGHVQGDAHIWHFGQHLLLTTDQAQVSKLHAFLDHFIIMDDVTLTPFTGEWSALLVTGPRAAEVLAAAGIPAAEAAQLSGTQLHSHGTPLYVLRREATPASNSSEQFELWIHPATKQALFNALVAQSATPAGSDAMELWRITQGIPLYGTDIRERDIPQEINQDARALHFAKGCYIGQEIVERIRSRGKVHRQFTGFTVIGTLPVPNTFIQREGRDIGEITSAALLPETAGNLAVALGYLRREFGAPATVLEIEGATLTVAPPPFVTNKKD